MSNFERGFFNNEDVSSSIKFAVLAILNRGNADEFNRGVNKNVPVIMANFPAEYGISSIGFDVGNEAVSNGNLLIKVKENEYTTSSFDCVSIIEGKLDDAEVLQESMRQIMTGYKEQLNSEPVKTYVPQLKVKLDAIEKVLKERDMHYAQYRESLEKFKDLAVQMYTNGQVKENQSNSNKSEGETPDDIKKKQTMMEQ